MKKKEGGRSDRSFGGDNVSSPNTAEVLAQLGGMLKGMEKNKGIQLDGRVIGGSTKELPKDPTPTYADLGLDKKTAMVLCVQ